VTPADVADLAFAEVLANKPRTAQRRAAVCLYYAATVPPARSLAAVRSAVGTFGTDAVQRAALELLDQLAAMTEPEEQTA
jgi:hypothetical protein